MINEPGYYGTNQLNAKTDREKKALIKSRWGLNRCPSMSKEHVSKRWKNRNKWKKKDDRNKIASFSKLITFSLNEALLFWAPTFYGFFADILSTLFLFALYTQGQFLFSFHSSLSTLEIINLSYNHSVISSFLKCLQISFYFDLAVNVVAEMTIPFRFCIMQQTQW